ncbi:MAG: nucleoside deaminase, partial [Angelakisella sp.]
MTELIDNEYYMSLALAEARLAGKRGEVPVGAVLVRRGEIIAACGNTREEEHDPLGHAEINVIRAGCRVLGDWRLSDCTLYVTLEPCSMCAGAILNARVAKVVYGAADPVAGVLGSRLHLFDLDLGFRP